MKDQTAPGPQSATNGWNTAYGVRLHDLRRSRGLLQQQVAAKVGVPRSVLSNWETAARRPSPAQFERLLEVLNVTPELMSPQADRPPPLELHDSGAEIGVEDGFDAAPRDRATLDGSSILDLVADSVTQVARDEIDRFVRQVGLYGRIGSTQLLARRWLQVRGKAVEASAAVTALPGQNAKTRAAAARAGYRLALDLRKHLDLAEAPLPELDALVEMLGVSIFRSSFRAHGERRMRGLMVEHGRVGAALLLNDDLTLRAQRLVLIECVARAILQPAGATTMSSMGGAPSRTNLDSAAAAFTREFAVPRRVVDLQFAYASDSAPDSAPERASDRASERASERACERASERAAESASERATEDPTAVDRSDDNVVAAFVDIATKYGVPPSYIQSVASLNLGEAQLKQIAVDLGLGLLRNRQSRRFVDQHQSWSRTVHDVPQRFLDGLLRSIKKGELSVAGAATLTAVAQTELEGLLAATEVEPPQDFEDPAWVGRWQFDVA